MQTEFKIMKSFMKSISNKKFEEFVKTATSWFDLLLKCGYKCREKKNVQNEITKTYQMTAKKIVRQRIISMGLSIEHFDTARRCKRWRSVHKLANKRRTAKQLRKILDKAGRLYICEWCRCDGMELWNGQWLWRDWPLTLQIDHVNGRACTDDDDKPENLRYLCPNCHSQTSTFGNKKKLAV